MERSVTVSDGALTVSRGAAGWPMLCIGGDSAYASLFLSLALETVADAAWRRPRL